MSIFQIIKTSCLKQLNLNRGMQQFCIVSELGDWKYHEENIEMYYVK